LKPQLQAERERRQNAGRRPPGPPPTPPSPEVAPKAQVNLTDADSRIMRVQGQGLEQCYNAQLAVDRESRLIVAPGLIQEVNDKQQRASALEKLRALPAELGTVPALVADNGFMSTVEPVIGIIQSVMKFRQFLLRGVHHVSGEWDWVCLAYHVRRMHRMQGT